MYSASILQWMSTHVTDTQEFTKILEGIIDPPSVKSGRVGGNKISENGSVTVQRPQKNDIDDFLSMIQMINN